MNETRWMRFLRSGEEPATILVVDDDPTIRSGVAKLLTHVGHSVRVAASAEEGDQWIAAGGIDLCLLDIDLPRMSGVEYLTWVQHRSPDTAVLMVTGVDDPDVAAECIDAGARTFLVKPIEPAFLLRAIRDALAVRRLLVGRSLTTF